MIFPYALPSNPSPLPSCSRRRAPADSEPMQHPIKSAFPNRTPMTRIGWISRDFSICANPRHPCNPCSMAALAVAEAPESRDVIQLKLPQAINLRSSMPKPCGFSTPRTRMPRRAYVDTPSRGVTLGAFICGSFFSEAQNINCFVFTLQHAMR